MSALLVFTLHELEISTQRIRLEPVTTYDAHSESAITGGIRVILSKNHMTEDDLMRQIRTFWAEPRAVCEDGCSKKLVEVFQIRKVM